MEVLAVTIFISLLLAIFFVFMFLGCQRGVKRGLEQEALLPLETRRDGKKASIDSSPH